MGVEPISEVHLVTECNRTRFHSLSTYSLKGHAAPQFRTYFTLGGRSTQAAKLTHPMMIIRMTRSSTIMPWALQLEQDLPEVT